jgi:FkbM family methyltransferase
MTSTTLSEIHALFDRSITSIQEYESSAFDRLLNLTSDGQIVLFGSGNLGRKTLQELRIVGIEPIAFSDNNSSLWNQTIEGIPVLSPENSAAKYGADALFVTTIWNASRKCRYPILRQQLTKLGCVNVTSFVPLFWKYPDLFLPHYCVDLPHKIYEDKERFLEAFALLSDDLSREQYLNQLRWRVFLDFDSLSIANDPQYFSKSALPPLKDEVFIDCGAFDGDTVGAIINFQNFHHNFRQLICFEPDPDNCQKLKKFVANLSPEFKEKIVIYQKATGKERGKIQFSAVGLASSAITEAGEIEVEAVSLDETVLENAPTFIKMDIEGAEIDTLIGARKIIEQHAPILAIASYHLQDHLWRIPLVIQSIREDYSFFLEQYGADGLEVVLYAIPNHRLIDRSASGI